MEVVSAVVKDHLANDCIERDAAVLVTHQVNHVLENLVAHCHFLLVAENSHLMSGKVARVLVRHDVEKVAQDRGEEEGVGVV